MGPRGRGDDAERRFDPPRRMNTPKLTPGEFIAAIAAKGERRTTPAGQGDLVWRIWGRGGPLVLLHGGTGSWLHWIRNVEDLARDHAVIVPDIPGSGESATPEPPPTADRIAASMLAGLDRLIGPDAGFAIAGFSMGGMIASHMAHQAGARVQCLVLVGSAGIPVKRPTMEPLVSWRRLPTEDAKRAAHKRNLEILMLHDPDNVDELAVQIQTTNAAHARVRGKHVAPSSALARCLEGYAGRLAGIWGEHDATAAPYFAERRQFLQQVQPAASFDIVPGVGHWVQYEASAAFNSRLREVVKSGS
jgi:2-hydroxy-6-oxonona-2,4-dienedioate hydrolase